MALVGTLISKNVTSLGMIARVLTSRAKSLESLALVGMSMVRGLIFLALVSISIVSSSSRLSGWARLLLRSMPVSRVCILGLYV